MTTKPPATDPKPLTADPDPGATEPKPSPQLKAPSEPTAGLRLPATVPPLVPPKPPLWTWRGPDRVPAAPPLIALLVAAVIGATAITVDSNGLGWLIGGVAATVALAVVVRKASLRQAAWGLATVALLAVGTVRAAGWLFVLCVLTAVATALLALVDARSIRAMALTVVLAPAAAFRALPWVRAGLAHVNGSRRPGATARALAIALASVVLLLVFGALFASADETFADLVDRALPTIGANTVARVLVLFPLLALLLGGAAFLLAGPPALAGLAGAPKNTLRRADWAIPVALLDLLFLAFVAVQATVLFGGARHVLEPDGPTFANYARGGFWQLLVVTGLTLLVITAAGRWAPRGTRADRVTIRVLLGALALLTLVIVASATHRMWTYEQAYGFTRLRLFVSAVELGLGAVFVAILAAGVRLRGGWLPQAFVAIATVSLLALAAVNPDRFIADRNVDRFAATGRIDLHYLNTLSADAVPALDRLTGADRACALWLAERRLQNQPDDWRTFNLARHHARSLLAAEPAGTCTTYRR